MQEFDEGAEDADLPPGQRLAKQRKSLKRKLGLEQPGLEQLVDAEELIRDEDLVSSSSVKCQAVTGQKDAASLISDMTGMTE